MKTLALFAQGKTRMTAIKVLPIRLDNSPFNSNTLGKFTS